jgi:hypothetical protein
MDNKKKIEHLISETLCKYEFELPKEEYSVIADELAEKIVKLFAIPDVVWQSEQVGVCMHNLDMTGRCFKCGEQYLRKEG